MKMRLKFLEFLAFSYPLFLSTSHAWTTHEFEPIQMERSLMGVSPLETHTVDSIVSIYFFLKNSYDICMNSLKSPF